MAEGKSSPELTSPEVSSEPELNGAVDREIPIDNGTVEQPETPKQEVLTLPEGKSLRDTLANDPSVILDQYAEALHNNPDKVNEIHLQITEAISELAEQATIDELTGLPNRRAFMVERKRAADVAQREKQPVAIACLDIVSLREWNTLGHEIGDRVIKQFARVLNERSRPNDRVFRIGGDEFAVILEGSKKADLFYDRVKRALDKVELEGKTIGFYTAAETYIPTNTKDVIDPYDRMKEVFEKAQHNLSVRKNGAKSG